MKRIAYFFGRKIPFFGIRFWTAGWKAHTIALKEFTFNLILSTIPIWLNWLLLRGFDQDISIKNLVRNGELFIYSTAVLAAITWINLKHSIELEDDDVVNIASSKSDNNEPMWVSVRKSVYPPDKFFVPIFIIIGFIVSVAFYAINVVNNFATSVILRNIVDSFKMDPEYMWEISRNTYIACLILYHNVLVSGHAGINKTLHETSAKNTNSFADGYAAHRRQ